MAVTQNTYTGNGSTVLYSFTFPYLETTDIKVSVNGTVTTAYTLANATTIQFNSAPANGAAIRIYRETDDSALAATFYPGSAIRSNDLNDNFTQNLYVTQESTNNAATATTTANTALTNSNTAISTANSAVSTANTASSNASAAVATANTASSNASAAVATANTASSNATAAVNTANAATATANSATSTANTALSTANAATSTANAASAAATNAVNTANAASSAASSAVSTANTASSNASAAVSTANTASSNATSAVNTANSALSTANAAASAVANAILYDIVANVAAIPGSPANNDAVEVTDSTGIESFTPLTGVPGGFVGDSGLSVRIVYTTTGSTWNWIQYFPNDPETRYGDAITTLQSDVTGLDNNKVAKAGDTMTGALGVTAGSAASPSVFISGDTNTGIYSPGADQLALSTNGTGRLFVDASGNVSVGSSSAFATSAGRGNITLNGSTDSLLAFGNAGSISAYLLSNSSELTILASGARNQTFYTNNTERLRITSGGLVGIGTSSPSRQLDVLVADNTTYAGNADNANALNLFNTSTTNETFSSIRLGSQGSASAGLVTLYGVQTANAAGSGYFAIATRNAGTFAERFRITPGGNVGIGSNSPDANLVVEAATGDATIRVHAAENNSASEPILILESSNDFAESIIEFKDSSGTGGGIRYNHGDNALRFQTNGSSERARIDSSGRLLVGTSSAPSVGASSNARAVIQGNSFDSNGSFVLSLQTGKAPTSIVSGDYMGQIMFTANNGSPFAEIAAVADANAGTNDYPGRLVFSTTADGASSPTERMRISQSGLLTHKVNGAVLRSHARADGAIQFAHNGVSDDIFWLNVTSTSYGSAAFRINCYRSGSADYTFAQWTSADLNDDEFRFRGDGQGYADGSWNGGGADYAEYFEWSDCNPDAEDRRGISVVLDGDKIREAQPGEDPIGVISGNPSVVGDAAWNKWSGKYLRDEFGTYIQEDYEVTDDDGNTVVQQRRKLNPAYDPNVEYISREQRPEWDCVGLMGKLRIRKGQVTGSRWIKMRDINDSVEEWLVR